jgi:spore coat protein CotF
MRDPALRQVIIDVLRMLKGLEKKLKELLDK